MELIDLDWGRTVHGSAFSKSFAFSGGRDRCVYVCGYAVGGQAGPTVAEAGINLPRNYLAVFFSPVVWTFIQYSKRMAVTEGGGLEMLAA